MYLEKDVHWRKIVYWRNSYCITGHKFTREKKLIREKKCTGEN